MSNGDNGGKGGNGNPPGTYLVIPYYPGDQGSRPLPSAELFWMCTSIMVNGSPYAGQQLPRGQNVNLTLNAINYGALTAPTLCLFFWANPTTGFTSATVQYIGQTSVALASNNLVTTPLVAWSVPQGTPDHICLLAEITTPADPAPGNYDAAADRHFGQQNVHLTSAAPGGQIKIPFVMGNSRTIPTRFRLEVTHVLVRHRALRHLVAENAVFHKAENINLMRSRAEAGQNLQSLRVELGVGELATIELTAVVPNDAKPGSTIILQLAQYEEKQHQPIGGMGVVVRVT